MAAVLLSGGVDSLVAAYLLKKAHPRAFGIYLKTGYNDLSDDEVQTISSRADMPVEVIGCQQDFKSGVVDYFTRSYLRGETPNPCLRCNPVIKFRVGIEQALKKGAQSVASGHYCRVEETSQGMRLLKGWDPKKDQSYFLAFLSREQLERVRFPVGHMTKTAVTALAHEKGLAPLRAGESQDVCFIRPEETYGQFIARQAGRVPQPGRIENMDGKVIGEHDGVHLFTVGQRRGINCPAAEPYYVAAIDVERNRICVGFRNDLMRTECLVRDVNWISPVSDADFSCFVKVRYQHKAVAATVRLLSEGKAGITFAWPQFGIAPGQGAVFYQEDIVLGGGIISG